MKNIYGDDLSKVNRGKGVDVASQRLDDLDKAALERIDALAAAARPVTVADYGCGRGGFAKAAQTRTPFIDAIDIEDFSEEFAGSHVAFRQTDMAQDLTGRREQYDIILCQRTIHYLRHPAAVEVCRLFAAALKSGGRLYISASGLGSELGDGYPDAGKPPKDRFSRLSGPNRRKHGIEPPVCLYRVDELAEVLAAAGFAVERKWASAFGNVKIIARKDDRAREAQDR